MNTHLENAFAKAALLSDDAQESIASLVLAEIDAERVWDERFAASQDKIDVLAEQALAEIAAGEIYGFGSVRTPITMR